MSNEAQIKRGITQAVRVVTAWLESDHKNADASFAQQQLVQIKQEGGDGDLVIGFIAAMGIVVDDLAAATGKSPADILREMALRAQQ